MLITCLVDFNLDALLMDLISRLQTRLLASGPEAAHLKIIAMCDESYAVANLVSNTTRPKLSLGYSTQILTASVVAVARVGTDQTAQESIVREVLTAACSAMDLSHHVSSEESFRPGRPVLSLRIV